MPKNVLQTRMCKVMNVDGIVKTVRGDKKHGMTQTFAHIQKHVCLAKVREEHLRLCVSGSLPRLDVGNIFYTTIFSSFFLSFFLSFVGLQIVRRQLFGYCCWRLSQARRLPARSVLSSLMIFWDVWKRTEVSLIFVQRGFNQAGNAII